MEQHIVLRRNEGWTTEHSNATSRISAELIVLETPLSVMADIQVRQAVIVVVHKRGTGRKPSIVRSAFRRHFFECSVSKIAVEMIPANPGDIQIRKPVTVEISRRQTSAVTGGHKTAYGSDIRERPVLEVAPEMSSR